MSLSKRVRFEIFKRDSFTCQYCGKRAPDVVLHADHIQPRAAGGTDHITNLITACEGCNLGKAAVPLSDSTAVAKQHDQLTRLQERQEQIEMMMQWQRSLMAIDEQAVDALADFWCELANWFDINEAGVRDLKKWLRKFGQEAVLEAMRIASETYFKYQDDQSAPTSESAEMGFLKIGGICSVRVASHDKPYLKDLYYIRGIFRNRINYRTIGYFNESLAMRTLETAFQLGGDPEKLKQMAKEVRNWSEWRDAMDEYCQELEELRPLSE